MNVFCGIDWAEKHHDIALVDAEGKLVAKRRITESVDGFGELTAMLAEAGDAAEAPIPVAIETPRGLLVAALRATGRPIYAINPQQVAAYRTRHSVSRKKSDHADAKTLANMGSRSFREERADIALVEQLGVDLQRRQVHEPRAGEHLENPQAFQHGQLVDRLQHRTRRYRRRERQGGLAVTDRRRPHQPGQHRCLSGDHAIGGQGCVGLGQRFLRFSSESALSERLSERACAFP